MEAIKLAKDKSKLEIYSAELLKEYCEELCPINSYTKEEIFADKGSFKDVKYIFSTWYMPEFTVDEIKTVFPSLEAVFYAAGTVKYFAEPFMKIGVKVFSAAKANGVPVAEFAASQIVLANKGYYQAQRAYRKPLYSFSFNNARKYVYARPGNYDATVGLIGFGAVGRKVAELLQQYQLKICAYDPYVDEEQMRELNVTKVTLEELFSNSDIISNHLPDTQETKGILNYRLFSTAKGTVTFINTGRGAQVVEKDLLRMLKEKPMACALLDVTSHEPMWPWSALNRRKNVFATPHIAGSTGRESQRMAQYMLEAYRDYKNGKSNSCEISINQLEQMT